LSGLWPGLCRASYYISLLGLKIPAGLLVRASRARYVLAFILMVWVPFLVCCHAVLLPKVQVANNGVAIWHVLTALWITIPLLTVGMVILSKIHAVGPFTAFIGALVGMALYHAYVIPALMPTRLGAVLLQALFIFFEDMPIVTWIWCLFHVVRLQEHIREHQQGRHNPFEDAKREESNVLIVGNAPTVTDGPPLGAIIDEFVNVVRFNSYSMDRPQYTGSKVGFHFCNGRNFPKTKAVTAVLPLFNASLTHAVYLFMPHVEDTVDIIANLTNDKVCSWFVEEQHILELRKKIGCRIWQIPTSGMVAIDCFLRNRQMVKLHGFNFFQSKKIHYFEESPTQLITSWLERFVTHDPSREKVWVGDLVKQGRASFLDPQGIKEEETHKQTETSKEQAQPAKLDAARSKPKSLDGEVRRRPGLMQAILRDGMPSQFSL